MKSLYYLFSDVRRAVDLRLLSKVSDSESRFLTDSHSIYDAGIPRYQACFTYIFRRKMQCIVFAEWKKK